MGYINKIDRLRSFLPGEKYNNNSGANRLYFTGGSFYEYNGGIVTEISGKLFSSSDNVGAITRNNYISIPEKLAENGLEVDTEFYLTQAALGCVDVKKDLSLNEKPENYLSELREILKRKTDKYDVYKYDDICYESGLAVVPKAASARHRFSIYNKGLELRKHKHKNIDYYNRFEYSYLEQLNHTIRCEYQTKNFAEIRKAYGIENGKIPTILDVVMCDKDVVSEQFSKLFKD